MISGQVCTESSIICDVWRKFSDLTGHKQDFPGPLTEWQTNYCPWKVSRDLSPCFSARAIRLDATLSRKVKLIGWRPWGNGVPESCQSNYSGRRRRLGTFSAVILCIGRFIIGEKRLSGSNLSSAKKVKFCAKKSRLFADWFPEKIFPQKKENLKRSWTRSKTWPWDSKSHKWSCLSFLQSAVVIGIWREIGFLFCLETLIIDVNKRNEVNLIGSRNFKSIGEMEARSSSRSRSQAWIKPPATAFTEFPSSDQTGRTSGFDSQRSNGSACQYMLKYLFCRLQWLNRAETGENLVVFPHPEKDRCNPQCVVTGSFCGSQCKESGMMSARSRYWTGRWANILGQREVHRVLLLPEVPCQPRWPSDVGLKRIWGWMEMH